jgi:hypothetical protein
LQPGENRQGKALGDEELGRFRSPGDKHGGQQNARRGPKNRPRTGFLNGSGGEEEERKAGRRLRFS